MDSVNNGRNSQLPGRQPAKHPPLGTVGVDHVGLESAKQFLDGPITKPVSPGMNGPAKGGDGFQLDVICAVLSQEGTFRTTGGARHEHHRISMFPYEVLAGEERVFLGPADDHSGDDMCNSHGRRSSGS